MADRLTEMLVFSKTVETGSFAGAAEQLGISGQMAGRHVAQLEKRLGARLLNRSTHGQSLTEAGESFLKGCRRVLAELDAVEEEVVGFTAVARGTLRVTAPVGIGSQMIAPRIQEFLDAYPEVRVELTLSDKPANIIDERYDASVRVGDMPDSAMLVRALGSFSIVTCASPGYLDQHGTPATPDDLALHHTVDFAFPSRTAPPLWWFQQDGEMLEFAPASRLVINDDRALIEAALSDGGIIRIAEPKVRRHLTDGSLVRLLTEYDATRWPLRLVFNPQKQFAPKLRVSIDWLTAAFADMR